VKIAKKVKMLSNFVAERISCLKNLTIFINLRSSDNHNRLFSEKI